MQKYTLRIVTIITILFLVGMQFLPVSVYATEEIEKNIKTSESNVTFDAKIGDKYEASAVIGESANLNISISVKNTGYLKNNIITLENNNFSLIPVQNEKIKSISVQENTITLNEINAGEDISLSIPVRLNKKDWASEEYFNKDYNIKFQAIYVNENGNERGIEKNVKEKLEWLANDKQIINQTMSRYIKYDNKTMISFEIEEQIENDLLPAVSKELNVEVPKLEGKEPSKIIVTANGTNQEYKDGILKIAKKQLRNENNELYWTSKDKYLVTYIYETQTEEEKIKSNAKINVIDIKGNNLFAETENKEYEITREIGNIVEAKSETSNQLSKGYMYANLNKIEEKYDTQYNVTYGINIGYAELADKIVLSENNEILSGESEIIADATNAIVNKKVTASSDEIREILGTEGKITIKNEEGDILAYLNAEGPSAEIDSEKIIIETTNPEKEGNLNITIGKVLLGTTPMTKEQIKSFKVLTESVKVQGKINEQLISEKDIESKIELVEPTSNVTLDVSEESLSTVSKNENVVFNINLNNKSVENTLFENPNIKIKLPDEVKGIEIIENQLMYDEELKIESLEAQGNEINIQIVGKQTKYNTLTGTVIRVNTNIYLDNLVPSNERNIVCECSNNLTEEVIRRDTPIKIIAPTGFVTTNTLTVEGKTATAVSNDAELIKIENTESSKTAEISGKVINNLGKTAEGFAIVGRIPFKGNKTIQGEELGSNINTNLATTVGVVGLNNARVYYSDNGEETIDGESWSEEATTNSKSFKIVSDENLEDKQEVDFSYNIAIPENIGEGALIKENYGVLYSNNSIEGVTRNLVEAKTVGAGTDTNLRLEMDVTIKDTNTGEKIEEGSDIRQGQYVTYTVKIENPSSADANNVKLTVNLPENMDKVEYVIPQYISAFPEYQVTTAEELGYKIEETIEKIAAGESKEIEINCIYQGDSGNSINMEFVVTADNLDTTLTKQLVNGSSQGTFSIKMVELDDNLYVEKDRLMYCYVTVKNVSNEEKENVSVRIHIPEGLEIDSAGDTNDKENYKEKNGYIVFEKQKFQEDETKGYQINFIGTDSISGEVFTQAEVITESETILSNKLQFINEKIEITASQSTNITSGKMMDSDVIELYVDVKNNTNKEKNITFTNTLSHELKAIKFKVNGNEEEYDKNDNVRFLQSKLILQPNATERITITAKVMGVEKGTNVTIENNPGIVTEKGTIIDINTVSITIIGTIERDENGDAYTGENNGELSLSGEVWVDKNNNGKKDSQEERLKNIKLTLYNVNTSSIAINSNDEELTAETSEDGTYTFDKIYNGKYIVIAEYNNELYGVAHYKDKNVEESENSDFINAKINEKNVAVTNNIDISGENLFNIDLGLVPKDTFDLKINKEINTITVVNSKNNKTRTYQYGKDLAKVELSMRNSEYDTIIVEYTITVTNEGQVAGYVKSIVDYLPKGMNFNSQQNTTWYIGSDSNAYNTSLANTILEPGDSKEISLVLTRRMTGEDTGLVRNTAEIQESYNEKGIKDIDSTAGNKKEGEDDISSADMVIAIATGKKVLIGASISVIILIISAAPIAYIKIRRKDD